MPASTATWDASNLVTGIPRWTQAHAHACMRSNMYTHTQQTAPPLHSKHCARPHDHREPVTMPTNNATHNRAPNPQMPYLHSSLFEAPPPHTHDIMHAGAHHHMHSS
mmetsp:Transcript_29024/g.64052  ORF Transcript_29024/g.64052 Transcript_29024/m.64052 type:complete len:107 (+) Transcript_29024:357-677(+)